MRDLVKILFGFSLLTLLAQPAGGEAPRGPSDESAGWRRLSDQAAAELADRVSRSVVTITAWREADAATATATGRPARHPGHVIVGQGSGFLLRAGGYLVSTYHTLVETGTQRLPHVIDVELHDGTRVAGTLVGVEPTLNLAVLKIPPPKDEQPVEVSLKENLKLDEPVMALAGVRPDGKSRHARGALHELPNKDCYQVYLTATLMKSRIALDSLYYGGPLVNERGQVVGINTIMYNPRVPGYRGEADGVEWAMPIDLVLNVYDPIRANQSFRSPWLGFSVKNPSRDERRGRGPGGRFLREGILLEDIWQNGPAARLGLKDGDFLIAMDDEPIQYVSDFQRWLYTFGIGKTLTLEMVRNGEHRDVTMTIEERPAWARPR